MNKRTNTADGINGVDPKWAWSPYEPDRERPWDRAAAAHLYRRAGFGASRQQLDEAIRAEPADAIERLLAPGAGTDDFDVQVDQLAQTVLATGDPKNLSAVWLYRLNGTPNPLLEKMTLFWHGHFATGADKVADAKMMLAQNELLRRHALGGFGEFVHAISRDPAMLVYLDSATNRKSHPNENYARELMELFCLGEGNYTEKDVQQLARCFTGWEVRRGRFRFNQYQHDEGEKNILGRSGSFDGEEAVNIILEQPAAPRFIARKLVKYFICDEPEPADHLIDPLAREFRDHELSVAPLVARIINSQLFFSDLVVGRKIRSPIDLAVGLLRALEGTTDVYGLSEQLAQLGHYLFYPPNVKGWDGGRTWINSSTLLGRANLVQDVLSSDKTRFARDTLESLLDSNGVQSPEDTVAWLTELLFAVQVPDDVRQQLVRLAAEGDGDRTRRTATVIHAMSTLPEFQLA
jgi:uncharacterized protein (DUF1800 family)